MKFLCVCLSPAIDLTVSLDSVPKDGQVLKNVRERSTVGGKGINVARWLAFRGAEVACCGFIGSDDDAIFSRELAKYGIIDLFTRVPGSTRRNEMISSPGLSFKLNRAAFPDLPETECDFPSDLNGITVVISGSLPANFHATHYAKLIAKARCAGAERIALDASGKALYHGLQAKPDIVKPNTDECSELLGFPISSRDDFLNATDLLHEKVKNAIISDGAAGCWFDGTFLPAQKVDVVDTTAAGDTLLAEYLYSGDPMLAVRAGSAACTMPGGEPYRGPLD